MFKKIRKAVIPVAGFGTRFLPVAKSVPKELLPLVDRPVLQFLVEEAVAAGIEEIIFVTSEEKEAVKNFFSPSPALEEKLRSKNSTAELDALQKISTLAHFEFVLQKEMLGDGHAILQAREKIGDEPFLVLFGDELIFSEIPATQQLVDFFEQKNSNIVGLQKVPQNEISKFGIVAIDDDFAIQKFVEKPSISEAPSDLAIVGKYICLPSIFKILEKNPNASGEIRLIDALTLLLENEKIYGCEIVGERFDCGDKFGWWKANLAVGLRHPEFGERAAEWLREIAARDQKL